MDDLVINKKWKKKVIINIVKISVLLWGGDSFTIH